MNWTIKEEESAKKEYLSMISALKDSDEFKNDWVGKWDDFEKPCFGKKTTIIKGDKYKFMKYWMKDQEILNDSDWNKIEKEDDDYYGDF